MAGTTYERFGLSCEGRACLWHRIRGQMADLDEYKRNAAGCLHLARSASEPEIEVMFLEMVRSWLLLVAQAERKRDHGDYRLPDPQPRASSDDGSLD